MLTIGERKCLESAAHALPAPEPIALYSAYECTAEPGVAADGRPGRPTEL